MTPESKIVPELTTRILRPSDLSQGELAEWELLAEAASVANPCLEPGFVMAAAAHLSKGVELVAMYAQDRLVAIIPAYRSNRLGRLPVPVGTRTGWLPSFLGEPPIAQGFGTPAGHAIIDELSRSRRSWLRLHNLDAGGDFAAGVQAAAHQRGFFVHSERWSRGYATRRPDPSYVDDASHANLARLRRQWRSFERSTGHELAIRDRREDANAMDVFMDLELRGWKGREGVAFGSKPGGAQFLRSMAPWFRERGRLRVWTLEAGDRVLAMKINLVHRDTIFCFAITFDEADGRLSPGLQLEIVNFDRFHAEPSARFMDSCASPNNRFANRLYPERRNLVSLDIGAGVAGRSLVRALPVARRALQSLRTRMRRPQARGGA